MIKYQKRKELVLLPFFMQKDIKRINFLPVSSTIRKTSLILRQLIFDIFTYFIIIQLNYLGIYIPKSDNKHISFNPFYKMYLFV